MAIDYTKYLPSATPSVGPSAPPSVGPLGGTPVAAPPPAPEPEVNRFDPFHPENLTPSDPMSQLGKLWADWNPVTLAGKVTGFGVSSVTGVAAEALGSVPRDIGDPNASRIDPTKYGHSPEEGVRLLNDLQHEFNGTVQSEGQDVHTGLGSGSLSAMFMQLGKWQQANDPDGWKSWQETLQKAQTAKGFAGTDIGSHAGEIMSDYIRGEAQKYNDTTAQGLQGWYAEMPELAYAGSGSYGQTLHDFLDGIMILQHKAEKGAAVLSGNQSGIGGLTGNVATGATDANGQPIMGRRSSGHPELGSRLDELLATPIKNLSPIESAALGGFQAGWTPDHVYNYLVSHGEGFSSDPGSQLLTSVALDPVGVGQLGLTAGSMAVEKAITAAEAGEAGAAASTRVGQIYRAVTKSIGTSVAEVAASPAGDAFKIARTILDPSSIGGGHGPIAMAKTDATAGAGMMMFMKGVGTGGFQNGARRAANLGVKSLFDRLTALTGMNNLRDWAMDAHVDELVGRGVTESVQDTPEEVLQFLMQNAPKNVVTRGAAFTMERAKFMLTSFEENQLVERFAKTTGISREAAMKEVGEMEGTEKALWHWLTYTDADQQFMAVKSAIHPSEWGNALEPRLDDLTILNPGEMDRLTGYNVVKDFKEGVKVTGADGSIETKMAAGDVAGSQADNVAAGVARGGTVESGGAMKPNAPAVPDGFQTNPNYAASGFTTPIDAPRDGLYHVTTAADAVRAEGFKSGTLEGFGSAGDATLQGRTSFVTNKARAQTYMDRITIAIKAAQGAMSKEDVVAYFKPIYQKAWGEQADKIMGVEMADNAAANASDAVEAAQQTLDDTVKRWTDKPKNHLRMEKDLVKLEGEGYATVDPTEAIDNATASAAETPEEVYNLVQRLDGRLVGSPNLTSIDRAVKLTAPFKVIAGKDLDQVEILQLASREKAAIKQGIDGGELTAKPEDLHVLPAQGAATAAAAAPLAAVLPPAAKAATEVVKLGRKEMVARWNSLMERYQVLRSFGNGMPATTSADVLKRVDALHDALERGEFHSALSQAETSSLPKRAKDFLASNTGSDGKPLWRIGFKPPGEVSTGLVHDGVGLVKRHGFSVDHVSDMLPPIKRGGPVTDAMSRFLPKAVTDSKVGRGAARLRDGLEVAMQTATDMVDGERIALSVEQSFRRQMSEAGYSDKFARNLFRVGRKAAENGEGGYSLAGMSYDQWWKASEATLKNVVGAEADKRAIFGMMVRASGGDLRLMGWSKGMTHQLRAGLVTRGIDPSNYLGKLTVGMYNTLRYTMNPMFFLQTVSDAPFFMLMRGVPFDVRGRLIEPGSELDRMSKIIDNIGRTSMTRHTGMDMTDRAFTIEAQRGIRDGLEAIPGVTQQIDRNIVKRAAAKVGAIGSVTRWGTRMQIRNELLFIKADIGDAVMDGLMNGGQKFIDENLARATTNAERLPWQNAANDIMKPIDDITERLTAKLGRVPSKNEIGVEYLTEMIHDSIQPTMTAEGTESYARVNSLGEYIQPTDVGQLLPLDAEYGVAKLQWPGVHSVKDVQKLLNEPIEAGGRKVAEITERLLDEGFHPDHVERFVNRVQFNWDNRWAGWRSALKMTPREMQGVQDLVAAAARRAGMSPVDWLTQVLPMTSTQTRDLDKAMQRILETLRKADTTAGLGVKDATRFVADHLQPSMKRTLLEHFGIQQWGQQAEDALEDLARRSALGEEIANVEVRRGVAAYAKVMKTSKALKMSNELKEIVNAMPVAGASEFNMTESVIGAMVRQNVQQLEKDAFRIANIQTERSVLERGLNHPVFGIYPSSYMWGKVIPETVRFIAREPFGMKTGFGALTYARIQQDIAIQQEYDPRMTDLYKALGKSAVMNFLSYASPSFPYEDMRGNMPMWFEQIAKDKGIDLEHLSQKEFDTMGFDRWTTKPLEALKEISGALKGPAPQPQVPSLTPGQASGLQTISEEGGATAPSGANAGATSTKPDLSAKVQGAQLGPVLGQSFADLSEALFK